MIKNPNDIKKALESLEFDTHWYRRVFHTFGVVFLIYYLIPNHILFPNSKTLLALILVSAAIILDILRIKKKIHSGHFFGLREYEIKRPASYVYFGFGIFILLIFFPQQIAIPCILCACLVDPILGESRRIFDNNKALIIGFFVCLTIFTITWHTAEIWIIPIIGSIGSIIGESIKIPWIDDDFLIQFLPAIILLALYLGLKATGIDILPEPVLFEITSIG